MPPRPDVSAERRAQIINAALACFSNKGYTNTTMDDIVAESGLSKGSLYWYFDSKDSLFAAAVASLFDDFGQVAMTEINQHETASEKLRAGARDLVDLCRKAQGLFGLFLEFWSQSNRREEVSQFWIGRLVEYAEWTTQIIEQGVRSGEFRPVDAENLVWAIMATYDGLAAYALMMPDLDLEEVSEAFIETLLKGLLPDGHERE